MGSTKAKFARVPPVSYIQPFFQNDHSVKAPIQTTTMKLEEKKLITKLISSGETEKAIDTLTTLLEGSKTSKDYLSTLVNISSRYHKFMEEKGRGILFKADEEVLQSRINNDLLNLLAQVEKPARTKTPPATEKPKPVKIRKEPVTPMPPEKSSSGGWKWLWIVGIAAAAIASYFIIVEKPVEVKFPKMCWLVEFDTRCCPQSFDRIRVEEAKRQMVVSVLLSKDLPDPLITGVIYDQNRNIMPIRQLTLTQAAGAICYTGLIQRTDLYFWSPGQYAIEFFVNQQPAGSMNFSIIP